MRLFFILFLLSSVAARAETAVAWIGTSDRGPIKSKGIYRVELDLETGQLTQATLAAEVRRPGFLSLDPSGKVLFAACDLPSGEGGVAAYRIDEGRTSLSLINHQTTGDGGAAHLGTDRTGRMLFSAQYGGGSVAVYPVGEDGMIGERSQLVEHEGSGPNPNRQEGPHPHWVGVDPENRFLFVPDLGTDRIVIYRIDPNTAQIEPHGEALCPKGGGPRHFKFHPSGQFAYIVNELHMSVTVFRYQSQKGLLTPIQTIPTLPEYYREGFNSCSEIRVHPTGRFVYVANRGHDSITAFSVSPETGRLRFVERESIRGAMPRNFNLDSSGRWLLAAGKDSDSLASFKVHPDRGSLLFSRHLVRCPVPMCVVFQTLN